MDEREVSGTTSAGSRVVAAGLVARAVVGTALVAAPAWVLASTGDAVAHQHRSLAVLLVISALAGALSLARVVVLVRRARQGGTGRTTGRRVLRGTGVAAGYALLAVMAAAVVWLRPFPATDDALAALVPDDRVDVVETGGWYAFVPRDVAPTAGLVYTPGARVDARAPAPVLRPLAEAGRVVVVLKPPLGIALTSPGQSGAAIAAYDDVDRWAVGGHSLGGVAAAQYAASHDEDVTGLLLHASYPMADMSDADLHVTSVWASHDGLTTAADVEASRALLPAGTTFVEVVGGVHAYFADYGPQPGDGQPTVSRATAQAEITQADLALMAVVAQR